MVTNQSAEISWSGTVPVSEHYDDPYYSLEDGKAEAEYVFMSGNGLPDRLEPGFHIAELGFGTGLNLLIAFEAARAKGALPLRYTGFEAHPIPPQDMARALAAFPELDAGWLVDAWAQRRPLEAEGLDAEVIFGDAARTLPNWPGRADAWFLDGFAPACNPGLWSPELMAQVAAHTKPGGTAATYTAAGHVRRGLAAAGFTVSRQPGFGRKRHMTTAVLNA